MRDQFRLGKKLILLFVSATLLISTLFIAGSFYVHYMDFDNMYKTDVSKIATVAANLSDGAFLRELYRAVSAEEYLRILEQGDEEQIIEWLKRRDFYDSYVSETEKMRLIERDMDAAYVYVQSQHGQLATYLISPSDPLSYLGTYEVNPPEFASLTANAHFDPIVTYTEDGWLCTGVEPIFDPDGNAVAIVCVDMDMNRIMNNHLMFLAAMLLFGALAVLASSFVSVRLIRRMVITPLSQLTAGAKKFGEAKDETQLRQSVVNFDIQSRDEMESLYQEIRQMQTRIIDYAGTITRETSERERIGAELSVATQIQSNMLPNAFPAFPGRKEFDLYATVTPAKEVGGDFYDFFLVDGDHLALVVADVSAKGIPAELFMVVAKTIIKNQTLTGKSPTEIMEEANRQLYENSGGDMFVRAWLGILELSTGTLRSANAEHVSPAFCPPHGAFSIPEERKGPALAKAKETRYEENMTTLKPGGSLFAYTDGLPEAASADDELFGVERMLDTLNEDAASRPIQTVRRMKKRMGNFVKDAPQNDDIVLLSLTFFGERNAKRSPALMEAPEGPDGRQAAWK